MIQWYHQTLYEPLSPGSFLGTQSLQLLTALKKFAWHPIYLNTPEVKLFFQFNSESIFSI